MIYSSGKHANLTVDPARKSWRASDTREERFEARVDRSASCHVWTGAVNDRGYGIFYYRGEKKRAHREAWEQANGPVPPGMVLDHICLNRRCVKLSHLRTATIKQNAENASGPYPSNTSGYRGVSFYKPRGTWYGRVEHNGVVHVTPYRKTAEEANADVIALRLELFTHNELDRMAS